MARPKKKTHPGSIYVRGGFSSRIYIEYRGQKIATGLRDSADNRLVAQEMLWILWRRDKGLEALQSPTAVEARTQMQEGAKASVAAGTTMAGITPDEAWDHYLTHMQAADRSKRTITAYKDAFEKLRPKSLDVSDIEEAARAFVMSWKGSPSSINIYLRNYETYLNYCYKKGWTDNRRADVRAYRRKGTEKVVTILTDDEWQSLSEYLTQNEVSHFTLLVHLMYETGLRIGEAMRLNRSQIVVIDGISVLRMTNKVTKKPEYIPVSKRVQALLSRLPATGALFPWQASSQSGLLRRFNHALDSCGVDSGKTGFHILRRTFRHRLKKANVDSGTTKRLMRHSDLKTTDEHYTLYETHELAKVIDEVNASLDRQKKKRRQKK